MASLAELKKKSQETLGKVKEQQSSGGSVADPDIWTPTYDKEKGVGYAKVRFLPAPEGEDYPFVTLYSHGFKGSNGKWYINNSLSTIKKKDPCGEMNSALWNSGIESDKEVARKYGRRTNIFANVLIIDDPMHPELNGRVMKYRYGPMISKILDERMFPKFESDEPLNPFCPWTGADFEIRIVTKKVGKDTVPNYEKSFFHENSKMGSDEFIEEVWGKCHSLAAIISEDKFKTYDELKNELYQTLGDTVGSGIPVVASFASEQLLQEKTEAPAKQSARARVDDLDDGDDGVFDTSTKPTGVDDDINFFNSL